MHAGGYLMVECKICGAKLKNRTSLMKHISVSFGKGNILHPCPWYVYLAKYEDRKELSRANLKRMYYKDGKSTPMIAKELGINKGALIRTLHWYGFKLRSISEAAKNQIARDGLWNKGETKYTHPSVKKYADSRLGNNNPFIKAPGYEARRRKSIEVFAKYRNRGIGNHSPKSTEQRMKSILDIEKIQFVDQFYIKYNSTWRLYDFLIEGSLIVEMQGNYYHANPSLYQPDDVIIIARQKRLAKDIWKYDANKKQLAIDSGYVFLPIWEKDFAKMSNEKVVDIIRSAI